MCFYTRLSNTNKPFNAMILTADDGEEMAKPGGGFKGLTGS